MPTLTPPGAKYEIKTQIFDQELSRDPTKPANERPRGGVAMMISKFEANTNSPRPLPSPPKPKRAFSNIFGGSKPSTPTANNKETPDRKIQHPCAPFSVTPQPRNDRVRHLASSSDTLVSSLSFPSSRRASFQPGTATRKSILVEVVPEESEANKPPEMDPHMSEIGTALDDDARSFDEGDDGLWYPPPQITRTETPNSLDYTHLGGLRLGSLHIVNGRASPAASDGSRHLLAKVAAPRRDASSDYGSESGQKDPILPNSRVPPFTRSREVSGLSSRGVKADTPVQKVNESRQQAEISERDTRTIISDFGTVASSIGGSPYDLARGQGQLPDSNRGRLNPSNISNQLPRARSTFDDHTASELARLRSRTIKEAEGDSEQVSSSDDPAYIARKQSEAPSMPHLLRQIRADNGRNSQQYPYQQERHQQQWRDPPPPPSHSPSPLLVDPEPHFQGLWNSQEAETPRPPCHSPQPMDVPPQMHPASPFLDSAEQQSRGRGQKDRGKVPRPPSHSPRPMDISPRKASPRPELVEGEQGLDMWRSSQDGTEGPPPPCHSPRPMDISPQKRQSRPVSFNEAQGIRKQWSREEEAEPDLGRQWNKDRARGPRPLGHSPRPMDMWPQRDSPRPVSFNEVQGLGKQWTEEAEAPPAPSHSPRPMDVWPHEPRAGPEDARQRQHGRDGWSAQAAIWRARRQTAGETLKRQSWQEEGGKQAWEEAVAG
ncbi:hypothetical protein DV737_g2247, partial [Chaetothyriales sp. CBS 132003]